MGSIGLLLPEYLASFDYADAGSGMTDCGLCAQDDKSYRLMLLRKQEIESEQIWSRCPRPREESPFGSLTLALRSPGQRLLPDVELVPGQFYGNDVVILTLAF